MTSPRNRTIALQAGLFVLVALVVIVLTRGGKRFDVDWEVVASCGPLAIAVVAPMIAAWDRRVASRWSIGLPVLSVFVANVLVWAWVAAATRADPVCKESHVPCEGVGIFLAVYPFYAAATLALCAVLAGAVYAITRLVTRMRGSLRGSP